MSRDQSDLLVVTHQIKAVSKCVMTMHGELSVMTALESMMLTWLVDNSATLVQVNCMIKSCKVVLIVDNTIV